MRLAVIAHDGKKAEMVAFLLENKKTNNSAKAVFMAICLNAIAIPTLKPAKNNHLIFF